jgi:hypothetical protein
MTWYTLQETGKVFGEAVKRRDKDIDCMLEER